MRSEWVPMSAAALVTGVMALVLAQMLNPAGVESSPADQLLIAADSPGRWLAMSVLFFAGASLLVLGLPAVVTLFDERRGRGLGVAGVGVFAVGCVGVGGLSALMLMFRALAIEAQVNGALAGSDIEMVTSSLQETGLSIILQVWVYAFLLGVLLIGLGLLRSRRVPGWVPGLLFAFLAIQLASPLLGESRAAEITSAVGLILLAGGFTGIATNAVSPRTRGPLTQTLVRS